MTKWLIGVCAIVLGGALVIEDAEARRLGGGRTTGVQRSVPNNPPANVPARPGQQQAAPNQAGQAAPAGAAAAAQPSGLSRWMPILGGLALGGMLGYLFGGNGLLGILLLAGLAIAAVLAFRALARRRAEGAPQPMQYAGLNQREMVTPPPAQTGLQAQSTRSTLPAGFDVAGFLRGAKLNFMKLQAANDAGQADPIREFTTDEMFNELQRDIAERGGSQQQTDIEGLEAELLEVASEGGQHWASVRFSGSVRETPDTAPAGFAEVWNLVKPADGSSGWLLAGIQQMH